jgi:VWFA-related protein
MTMRHAAAVALIAFVGVGLGEPQVRGQEAQSRPTFRGGIDAVQLDVTVLDKDRKPLRGLTAADFTVLEDGVPRPIVAVTPVELPRAATPGAAWMRDVAPDVVSNSRDTGRVIVILFDDAYTGFDSPALVIGRRIARAVIDDLGPADAAAVTFTFMGTKQDFTPDHARLLKAVDSYTPKNSFGAGAPLGCAFRGRSGCVLDAIEHIADALPLLPPRRKVLVLISAGGFPIPALDFDQDAPANGDAPSPELRDAARVLRKLQEANISVYAFSPNGLEVRGFNSGDEKLRMLAEQTGGDVGLNTNAPWDNVRVMFAETQSYYLVAFQSGHEDGRVHRIRVRVNRPGAEVRARSDYVAPDLDHPKKTRKPAPVHTPLETALASGLPDSTLPIDASIAAFADPGRRTITLHVIASVRPGLGDAYAHRVTIRTSVFDKEWKERGRDLQVVTMSSPANGAGGIVTAALPIKPGRYELRLAAESDGKAGSLFTDVDIPNVRNERLSASGVLVGAPIALMVHSDGRTASWPIRPTTVRTFRRDERASVFFEVYQGGRSAPMPVSLHATVLDRSGAVVVDETRDVAADRFVADRRAPVVYDLPLTQLGTGDYLVTLDIALRKEHVQRTVRFRMSSSLQCAGAPPPALRASPPHYVRGLAVSSFLMTFAIFAPSREAFFWLLASNF